MNYTQNFFTPTDEHLMIRKLVKDFASKKLSPSALERNEKEHFDLNLFKELGQLGLLGVCAPESYGGFNMDAVACVMVHEELSFFDPGFCLAYLAHSVLCINNIVQNANQEQKSLFLPKLITGEYLGAMAMSEPYVGTDVLGMKTFACKNNDGYLINGRKMWITNGVKEDKNTCDVVFLYAKTGDNKKDISSFLVSSKNNGFFVGQKLTGKLGMRSSNTAELVFDNCQVSKDQIVGQEGESMLHMMKNLEIERLALAAMGLGIAKRCLDIMNNYALEREAFGYSLNHFGQIKKFIAESYAQFKAVKAFVYLTAHGLSYGNKRIDSDSAKLLAAKMAKEVADNAIQILGGYGYMSEYVVERMWRDAKLLEIGGGTLEAHHKNITADLAKNHHVIFE